MVEDKQPDGRRKIALTVIGIDGSHEVRQGHVTKRGDLFQAVPERVFETDAGLVAGNHDGAFDNRRFSLVLSYFDPVPFEIAVRFGLACGFELARIFRLAVGEPVGVGPRFVLPPLWPACARFAD